MLHARREWRAEHYTEQAGLARAEARTRRKASDRKFIARDAELAARAAVQADERRVAAAIEQVNEASSSTKEAN